MESSEVSLAASSWDEASNVGRDVLKAAVIARGACVLMELVKAGRIDARAEDAVRRAVALGAARARARKECMVGVEELKWLVARDVMRIGSVKNKVVEWVEQLVMIQVDGDVFTVT
jgi:hypothetical protein